MFCRSASLAILHRESLAAIPSANRSVKLPLFRHFEDRFRRNGGKRALKLFREVCVFDVSRAVRTARFESASESQPNRTIQCH